MQECLRETFYGRFIMKETNIFIPLTPFCLFSRVQINYDFNSNFKLRYNRGKYRSYMTKLDGKTHNI